MINETTLHPGVGIGNIRLGRSMYETMKSLSKHHYKLRVSYSEHNYLKLPVLVTLQDYGIRLTFKNNEDQCLQLIEILDVTRSNRSNGYKLLTLLYNDFKLNEFERTDDLPLDGLESTCSSLSSDDKTLVSTCSTSLRLIYNKLFGPTYPGKLTDNVYILSYPGISFKFVVSNTQLLEKVQAIDCDELRLSTLLNWDTPNDITCSAIAIYKGDSWQDFDFKKKMTESTDGKKDNLISRLSVDLDRGVTRIQFKNGSSAQIVIGSTSQQDMLNILGPPDDYFTKFGSPLLIHGAQAYPGAQTNTEGVHHKFHNYFRYGLDVMYDPHSLLGHPTVKKVVLHNGGIAESLNFMKWDQCNWEVTSSDVSFNSQMNFSEMPSQLRLLVPVLLNRLESEYFDGDLDIIELPNDGPNDGAVSAKAKTWGQSKLYSYKRCIFEVLDLNGFVSCITVF